MHLTATCTRSARTFDVANVNPGADTSPFRHGVSLPRLLWTDQSKRSDSSAPGASVCVDRILFRYTYDNTIAPHPITPAARR